MNIGIYGRKSVYSDKSDSVENQIKLCREYIERLYPGSNIIIYDKDEGFSGGNDNRPSFKQMMADVENEILNMVICYKIDRFSRNVSDFSRYFNILQQHNVAFISATENIDTSTPLGRAMMYICSVFAQMERENIAARVKDNMIELAKSGKWTGGNPPLGLKRNKITVNKKSHTTIKVCEEELPLLNKIFDTFLEGNSLNQIETIFRNNNVLSPAGKTLSSTQIHQILSNPHYVNNSKEVYDYFKNKGCIMASERDEFDGTKGIMVYGRTTGSRTKKHIKNTPDKWIVSIALHKPLMDSKKWLAVQERFGKNKAIKEKKHNFGILDGALRCKCGGLMKPKHKYDKLYNKTYDRYHCYKKSRYGSCDMVQIDYTLLDNAFIDKMNEIVLDKENLNFMVKQDNTINNHREKLVVEKEISSLENNINNLSKTLYENNTSAASKYIIAEIEKLDSKINSLKREILEIDAMERERMNTIDNIDILYNEISSVMYNFDNMNFKDKNNFIRNTFECVWDGIELNIFFKNS